MIAEPTRRPGIRSTPGWKAPGGLQLTLFQELGDAPRARTDALPTRRCVSSASPTCTATCPAIPPCDVLLVAGDICPTDDERPETQRRWLRLDVRALARRRACRRPSSAWRATTTSSARPTRARCAISTGTTCRTRRSRSVACRSSAHHGRRASRTGRSCSSEDELAERWALIPDGDRRALRPLAAARLRRLDQRTEIGSPSLLAAIDERKPELCVFGHVHQGYGRWQRGAATLVNAAYCGMDYLPAHEPVVVEL